METIKIGRVLGVVALSVVIPMRTVGLSGSSTHVDQPTAWRGGTIAVELVGAHNRNSV